MRFAGSVLLCTFFALYNAYQPLRPPVKRSFPRANATQVGEPLFLTPYIESGDIVTGRSMALVDWNLLQGLNEEIESYSGLLTVDPANNGNMFFWFFPAQENPETAPVVIWLQGGPGSSSMFGALKLHGPVLTTVDENNELTGVASNPYTWAKKHNVIYIDNPVGAGYSFSDKLPTTNDDVTDNLYECLQQWFKLFPEYQGNPFYAFGESYAGKFVPAITRRIHEQNEAGNADLIQINIGGLGIGDGWMSPYHNGRYANFLYQASLLDAKQRDECLAYETETQRLIDAGQFYEAWLSWNNEFGTMLDYMGCPYYYNIAICEFDPTEDNYEDFCNLDSTRQALHVGDLEFPNSGDVYFSMINVFMDDGREDVEFCLENYRTLIYNGNFDIICDHSGILDMIDDLNWSGQDNYQNALRSVYKSSNGDVIGYLTKADNLNLLAVRNAGHMVPLSQPPYAQQMIEEFTDGTM